MEFVAALDEVTRPVHRPPKSYVIAVRFTGAILGNVLMWSGSVLYPIYAPGERYWHISPIADQSTAGVIIAETMVSDAPAPSEEPIAGRLANAPGRPCAR